MKFRQHRGGLAESMETVVEFSTMQEFWGYLKKTFGLKDGEVIDSAPYGSDARIGWNNVYIVSCSSGVLGFTDGRLPD